MLLDVADQTAFMSCSAQPGWGWMILVSCAALATSVPLRSKMTLFIIVVPTSIPNRYLVLTFFLLVFGDQPMRVGPKSAGSLPKYSSGWG